MKSQIFNNEVLAAGAKESDRVESKEAREGKKRGNTEEDGSMCTDNHRASVPMCKECDIAEVGMAGKRSMGCLLLISNP